MVASSLSKILPRHRFAEHSLQLLKNQVLASIEEDSSPNFSSTVSVGGVQLLTQDLLNHKALSRALSQKTLPFLSPSLEAVKAQQVSTKFSTAKRLELFAVPEEKATPCSYLHGQSLLSQKCAAVMRIPSSLPRTRKASALRLRKQVPGVRQPSPPGSLFSFPKERKLPVFNQRLKQYVPGLESSFASAASFEGPGPCPIPADVAPRSPPSN
jgi:hypothetical protein